jgi:hypothetical protein
MPSLPTSFNSPLKPSNTTLDLENGKTEHPPAQLTKSTPNFHLLMSALEDSPEFCKTTLSAMILNYPPATVVNMFQSFNSQATREKSRIKGVLEYLNSKLVKDDDLVLIVDGQDTWFQLPSDVIIRQYHNVVVDATNKLLAQYGTNEEGYPSTNNTIIFGAEKTCAGEDLACKYAPSSDLPNNIYGSQTGKETVFTPAKYLDSGMMMGPAQDLRALYKTAVKKFDEKSSQSGTAQSVFATIFGEQELARSNGNNTGTGKSVSQSHKWFSWFGGRAGTAGAAEAEEEPEPNASLTLQEGQQYEFSIGLDYTHSLFQTFLHVAEDELVPLAHDNSTGLEDHRHPGTPTISLSLPNAILKARPPFWTPDLSKNNPSPNDKPSYIEPLQIQKDLDQMKPRKTSWEEVELIQNTYTGAIPAIFHLNQPSAPLKAREAKIPDPRAHSVPTANLTWSSFWYAGYERALLRKYLRIPQSPIGYHMAAVGGDGMWDQRGGRGGIWTATEEVWLPWGEIDGVCGTLEQLKRTFADGKGVWLHEHDNNAEDDRRKEEEELNNKIKEAEEKAQQEIDKAKDEERKKKIQEEKAKADTQRKKLEEQNKQRQKEEEERKKKEEEEKKKQEDEERKKQEEEAKRIQEEEAKKKAQEEEEKKKQGDEQKKNQDGDESKTQNEEESHNEEGGDQRRRRRWVA